MEDSRREAPGRRTLENCVFRDRNVNFSLTGKWKTQTRGAWSQMPLCWSLHIHAKLKYPTLSWTVTVSDAYVNMGNTFFFLIKTFNFCRENARGCLKYILLKEKPVLNRFFIEHESDFKPGKNMKKKKV